MRGGKGRQSWGWGPQDAVLMRSMNAVSQPYFSQQQHQKTKLAWQFCNS